ncbi:magnesium citrate secondary transporter [uncultured Pontibacter sp.]|uniref:magnesium citrate secondary transporter n=1 Tax=uncultured Pontibacter sp. TaxID=453356 RepID=UPI002610E8A4|nr:magnesium citrate secondary transporter [uncultured Pontibacter sp.]
MRTLRHPVFLVSVVLFLVNQALEQTGVFFPLLFSYLDDLLAMPIVLTIILAAERIYFRKDDFVLPLAWISGAVAAFSVFFELILPPFSQKHTADWLDVVAYAVGAVLFHFTVNRPLCVSNTPARS